MQRTTAFLTEIQNLNVVSELNELCEEKVQNLLVSLPFGLVIKGLDKSSIKTIFEFKNLFN